MICQTKSQQQLIRNLFSLTSLIFLSLLSFEVIKIYSEYLPEQLYVSDSDVQLIRPKEYHAENTYNSVQIIDQDSKCSTGYSPSLQLENVDRVTYCQCREKVYFRYCNDKIENSDCYLISDSSIYSDLLLLFNPINGDSIPPNQENIRNVKLCGKKIDSSNITWMRDFNENNESFTKYCIFSDTYKLGVVNKSIECPLTSTDFQCDHSSQQKCETEYFISCTSQIGECPSTPCKQNEKLCISKSSMVCIKNIEQCPLTDIKLILASSIIPQGYEEFEMEAESYYKLIGKRSDIKDDYITKFSINPISIDQEGQPFQGFDQQDLFSFLETNKIELRRKPNNGINIVRIHKKKFIYPEYERITICKGFNLEEFNARVDWNYNLKLKPRTWCIRLLLLKIFFDCVSQAQRKKYQNRENEDSLRNLIDKCNIRFVFLGETVLLIFILTYCTEHIFQKEDYKFIDCLEAINKYDAWYDASELLQIDYIKEQTHVYYWVGVYSLFKLITLFLIIKKTCQRQEESLSQVLLKEPQEQNQQLEEPSSIFKSVN